MDWKYLFTSFEGRIGRQQFWIGVAVMVVASIILSFVLSSIFGGGALGTTLGETVSPGELMRANSASGWASLITIALLSYPFLALALKRRHDRGSEGRTIKIYLGVTILLVLMQTFGIGYSVQNFAGVQMVMPGALTGAIGIGVGLLGLYLLVVMGFLRGDDGPNSYGADPLE